MPQVDVRLIALLMGKQMTTVVREDEQGSRKEQNKRNAAQGDHEPEIGPLFVLRGQRIGSGWIRHTWWDAQVWRDDVARNGHGAHLPGWPVPRTPGRPVPPVDWGLSYV